MTSLWGVLFRNVKKRVSHSVHVPDGAVLIRKEAAFPDGFVSGKAAAFLLVRNGPLFFICAEEYEEGISGAVIFKIFHVRDGEFLFAGRHFENQKPCAAFVFCQIILVSPSLPSAYPFSSGVTTLLPEPGTLHPITDTASSAVNKREAIFFFIFRFLSKIQ